ncbi:MAG: LmeA family phospholipid-binding protein [Armatimonadota bacterium]|nr:LmeA family phospholipid-binding protein [Armatimonadota bacterium]MDR7520452.1 LmeA family phospholipid-binding protein [Armatimonadota bacterium]MDR7550520.1 LmeA family phospholipid-binding protein [Armatimonadota bacterium]
MRRALWIVAGLAALIAAWVLLPSVLLQQSVAAALRPHVEEAGTLHVRARATAWGLLRGRIARLEIDATRVRLGDVTAGQLSGKLRGVTFRREPLRRWTVTGVEGGTLEIQVGQHDLEAYLRARGVERPSVTIDTRGVAASGELRAGPLVATARLRGQFYVSGGTDLYFQITSLNLSGTDLPPGLTAAVLGVAGRPVLSLRSLPVSVTVTQIAYRDGRLTVGARAGAAP